MKIKNEVRYALQIIYYLTLNRDKDIISSNEISAKGGYVLTRDPKRLTFRDIIEIIDDDIVLQPCIDSSTICSTRGADCTIRHALKKIQDDLLDDFDKINFYDLVENNASLQI